MDMKQYSGSESKYLKAADLMGRKPKVTIESVELVEFEDRDNEGKKIRKPALRLKGKEKMLVCGPQSVEELCLAFGEDSDDWIGKELGLSTKFYPAFGKEGIVVTPISAEPKFEDDDPDDLPF